MKTVRVRKRVPCEVCRKKRPSCIRFSSVTSCPRWKVAPNGAICFSSESVSSCPVHTGTAGMS